MGLNKTIQRSIAVLAGALFFIGCADDEVAPAPSSGGGGPIDFREATIGVYSGRAYYRHSSFNITLDSVNWASDAIVSMDPSNDSSIVISSLDTMMLSADLTFVGSFIDAPPPMNWFIASSGEFRSTEDTTYLEFACSSPIDGLDTEYVFKGYRLN
ncbi:MAG TPA: hypothetical protein PLB89_12765 [Flavobacteriales bacterium]|nr:hypothetical protein [Flavobacteriales bacterium]